MLEQEPIADAIARADKTVRFNATNGEENGPYRIDKFAVLRGDQRIRAVGMSVLGKVLTVRFPVLIDAGDTIDTG